MTTITLTADEVLTHGQLADAVGGMQELHAILPEAWDGDTSDIRQSGVRAVALVLASRTPPIRQSDLADPTELREVVTAYALSRIYEHAITSEGDVFHVKQRLYERRYQNGVQGLAPTVFGEARGPGGSITVGRR